PSQTHEKQQARMRAQTNRETTGPHRESAPLHLFALFPAVIREGRFRQLPAKTPCAVNIGIIPEPAHGLLSVTSAERPLYLLFLAETPSVTGGVRISTRHSNLSSQASVRSAGPAANGTRRESSCTST